MLPPTFRPLEYDFALAAFLDEAVSAQARAMHPVLRAIPVERRSSVVASRNTMPDGTIIEGAPVQLDVRVRLSLDEILAGSPVTIEAFVNEAARQSIKKFMPYFYEKIGRISEAAGRVSYGDGRPIDHETVIRGFGHLDIDFDDEGMPILPMVIIHPSDMERLRKQPVTEAHLRLFEEIIERKRAEYLARKRFRRLI